MVFVDGDRAVQPLVQQHVRVPGQVLPLGEGARWASVQHCFVFVVHVIATLAHTRFAVLLEQAAKIAKQVRVGTEVADVLVAPRGRGDRLTHFGTVVPVVTVALDDRGADVEAPKDVLECGFDRRGPGARRAGDGNNWMLLGHVNSPSLLRPDLGPAPYPGFTLAPAKIIKTKYCLSVS